MGNASEKNTLYPNERNPQPEQRHDSSLKGAFVSVLLLGGFIALTWFGVFALFLARN